MRYSLLSIFLLASVIFAAEPTAIVVPKTLKKSYDKIDKVSTYRSKSTSPNIFGDMWTPLQLIMKHQENSSPSLILLIKWRGSDWVFAQSAKLILNDNQLELSLPERVTSVDGANVNELYYVRLTDSQIASLKTYLYAIDKKSSISLRLYGSSGYVDIPGGALVMGGVSGKMLLKNGFEMLEVLKFYDQIQGNKN
ncbi:MAG: hypothetical protein ACRC9L_04880 [Brevinema sp.]